MEEVEHTAVVVGIGTVVVDIEDVVVDIEDVALGPHTQGLEEVHKSLAEEGERTGVEELHKSLAEEGADQGRDHAAGQHRLVGWVAVDKLAASGAGKSVQGAYGEVVLAWGEVVLAWEDSVHWLVAWTQFA